MTQPEPSGSRHLRAKLFPALPFIFLFIGITIVTIVSSMAFGPPPKWIGHAFAAFIGLTLLVLVIVTGAVQAGRIRFMHIRHLFLVHRIAGACFAGFVVGTFLLGLMIMIGLHEPILTSSHGILGLIVAVMASFQFLLSLARTGRRSIRTVHTIIGYLIVPLFVLQIILGMDAAELFEAFGE